MTRGCYDDMSGSSKLWTLERRISDSILHADYKYMVLQYREVCTIILISCILLCYNL